MQFQLPDAPRTFVTEQAAREGSSEGAYLEKLVREAKERLDQDELRQNLLAGVRSESSNMTAGDWARLRSLAEKGRDEP